MCANKFGNIAEVPPLNSQAANVVWEKVSRGVSKPGGFPHFSGKVRIMSQTLPGLL